MRNKLGIVAQPLTFGTGPTNATTAKRMATRGTPVSEIAAHLEITPEAVHRILRAAKTPPKERGVAPQVECEACGTKLLQKSLSKHKRLVCRGQRAA
jgi:predicted transcriptional regulator